ncbi:MAG: hypothetical protein ACYS26_10745 [Planctomycetota bacterium]
MGDAFLFKRRAGRTSLTSVGMFASVTGFDFNFATDPLTARFAVRLKELIESGEGLQPVTGMLIAPQLPGHADGRRTPDASRTPLAWASDRPRTSASSTH